MLNELPRLSWGKADFDLIRALDCVYVDKTDLIYKLAAYSNDRLFLARPRRFGKSMLISTFESLFSHGLRDFKGLAIESLWNDRQYTVVRLDFSEAKQFSNFETFNSLFETHLIESFSRSGFVYDPTKVTGVISQISDWFLSQPIGSVVLLIDEYDAPLTNCLDRPKLFEKVQLIVSHFFSRIKRADRCLRFLFITGITKLTSTNIFSSFNALQDISLDEKYGTILGYTREEIKKNFSAHLTNAAAKLNTTEEEVLNLMADYYDGFSFDTYGKTHVFCPWSVMAFLSNPESGFENYWYTSGGLPDVLLKFLRNHQLVNIEHFAKDKTVFLSQLKASAPYDKLDLDILLCQAGYLSIKGSDGFQVRLGYPNKEVESSLAMLYASELIKPGASIMRDNSLTAEDFLSSYAVNEVISYFNEIFNAIDYNRYPIVDEASCRSHLQMLLYGSGIASIVEKHSALGRSDLEFSVGSRYWVLEFKYARSDESVPILLKEAVSQIESKQYGPAICQKTLIKVALVFSEVKRQIVAWKQL